MRGSSTILHKTPACSPESPDPHRVVGRGAVLAGGGPFRWPASGQLAFARGEVDAGRAAREEARREVQAMGYHRRDPELEALTRLG